MTEKNGWSVNCVKYCIHLKNFITCVTVTELVKTERASVQYVLYSEHGWSY